MPDERVRPHRGDISELDRLFAPIAQVLEAFRERHGLCIEKYYHEEPSWSFAFRHPSGGLAKISVLCYRPDEADVLSSWWYDDYDTMKRHMKHTREKNLSAKAEIIDKELERSLRSILSWDFGGWDEVYGDNKTWQKMWTREQFQQLAEKYPVPK